MPLSERWRIDFKLSLAEWQGKWTFAVDGSTDLPAGTVLRKRVFVVNLVKDPVEGDREDDDEALVREEDGPQPASCRFTVGSGGFHEDVHTFLRKPYSLLYRAKIFCLPEDQTPANGLKIGNDAFERKADLRVGNEESYRKELRERLQEAGRQLAVLEKLGLELAAQIEQRPLNPAAWSTWKDAAATQLDGIREENDRRFSLWAVWMEGQSRMRVGGLCELLQHILRAVDETDGDERRIDTLTRGYRESLEEAIDVIGADVPLNPSRAKAILKVYEKALEPLREILHPAPALVRRAHTDSLAALFDLTSMLRVRRRGYAYVSRIGERLARVFDLVEDRAPIDDLAKAFREQAEALLEFKAFAGLP